MDAGLLAPEEPCSPEKTSEENYVSTQYSEKEKKNRDNLYCTTCKVTVNSASQMQAHNAG